MWCACMRVHGLRVRQVTVDPGALRQAVTDILEAVGAPRDHAVTAADVLVTADERGIPSHGVMP